MKLLTLCTAALLVVQTTGTAIKHRFNGFTLTEHSDPVQRDLLQKHVCDEMLDSDYMAQRIDCFDVGDLG